MNCFPYVSLNDTSTSSANRYYGVKVFCCSGNTPEENTRVMTWNLMLLHWYSGFIMASVWLIIVWTAIHQRFWMHLTQFPCGSAVWCSALPIPYTLSTGFDYRLMLFGHICLYYSVSCHPSELLAWNTNNITRGAELLFKTTCLSHRSTTVLSRAALASLIIFTWVSRYVNWNPSGSRLCIWNCSAKWLLQAKLQPCLCL